MFNLAEILTIIIGLLIVLVIFDGLRRALRNRNEALKVQLSEMYDQSKYDSKEPIPERNLFKESQIEERDQTEETNSLRENLNFLIINLNAKKDYPFSCSSIMQKLNSFKPKYEEKGFFTFRDHSNQVLFTLINAKNPGTFTENNNSSDIALVLDVTKVMNPVETFENFFSVAEFISEAYFCNVLDENRNILTKQMVHHMRYKAQEYQRQSAISAQ